MKKKKKKQGKKINITIKWSASASASTNTIHTLFFRLNHFNAVNGTNDASTYSNQSSFYKTQRGGQCNFYLSITSLTWSQMICQDIFQNKIGNEKTQHT